MKQIINFIKNNKFSLFIYQLYKELSSDPKKFRIVNDFFVVNPSIWPILTSFSLLGLAISTVGFFHYIKYCLFFMFLFFSLILRFADFWWNDLIKETQNYKLYTLLILIQNNLKLGMIIFFGTFFHKSLSHYIFAIYFITNFFCGVFFEKKQQCILILS